MKNIRNILRVSLYGIKSGRVLMVIMFLLCCLIFPVFTLLQQTEYRVFNSDWMIIYSVIAAYAAGIIAPVTFFSYLHKRTEQDFYSAMPVTRTQYFVGYALSSFLIFIVPYLLMFGIHSFFPHEGNIWTAFWRPVGMFFVLYCSLTLCMIFSTSNWGTVVTLALRNGLAVSLVILPFTIARFDTNAYFELLSDKILMFTPLGTAFCINGSYYHILFVQLAVAVLELAAAYVIYKKRKNETALALAFPKTRYFFQYSVMTVGTLLTAGVLVSMMRVTLYSGNDLKTIVTCFFLVLVLSFIIFIMLNMILEKNSRSAFHKLRHFFIFIVSFAIITSVTVSLLVSNLPYSTLPFSPECAVVSVYSLEKQINDNPPSEPGSFSFTVGVTENDETKYETITAKPIGIFTVNNRENLSKLIDCAQNPKIFDSKEGICLLAHNRAFHNAIYSFDLSEETVVIQVAFYNQEPHFSEGASIEEINQEILDYSPSWEYYKQSIRYGVARNEEYISQFCDKPII